MADNPAFDSAVEPVPNDYLIPSGADRVLKSVTASFDGTGAAASFQPAVQILAPSGAVVVTAVCPTIVVAGGTADASWFPGADLDEETGDVTAGVIVDQFLVDSKSSSETSGTFVLQAGVEYLVTAQGTWSNWNSTLEVGTPNANAMFPSSTSGRVSTQVGVDPECWFAFHRLSPSDALGHKTAWQFDLGSGHSYITPQGGPYATPQPNYLYRYSVTGQGQVLKALVVDSGPYTDNYGKVQVTVYSLSGSSSGGGGGGALVPPAGGAPDGDVLTLAGGFATWAAPNRTRTLNVVINGGGAVITTGVAGDLFIDFACTITKVTMLADTSGSIVVDIWKAPYGSFPPTVANTIVASDPPTISSSVSSQDSTLTGWTTAINAGDVLRFNVNSVTSIKRLDLALTLAA